MITSTTILFLIGTFPHWTAHSHESVKITVNEHFNGQILACGDNCAPDAQKLSPNIPNFVHQGANFFFNPQLLLSPNYVTNHIEAVIDSLKEKNNTSSNKDPHTTTVPTSFPDQPKLTEVPEVTTEKVISAEIIENVKPPSAPDHACTLIEEPLETPPPLQPIIHEHSIVDILPPVIPDAPELPPLNFTDPIIVEERPAEVVIEPVLSPVELLEPEIIESETIITIPSISEIPAAPVLPPLILPEFPEHINIEVIHEPKPYIEEVITIKDELIIPKPRKLFGLLTSVISILEGKCEPCLDLGSNIPVAAQKLPLILPDTIKPIPSGKPSKTIVLLPTISELPLFPIPKLPLDFISKKSKSARLVYTTACAHNIIAQRIVPNIILSENSPKHLKLLSVPAALRFPVKYRN